MMHRNNAGFIALPVAAYAAAGAAVVILGLGAWGWIEKSRYEALKAEYEQFKGGVEALGLAAKKAAAEKEAQDKLRKEQADELHRKAVDQLNADIRRLRAQRAGPGGLSGTSPLTASATGACFEPAKLAAALRALDDGVLGLVESGAKAVTDLDSAKAWAQGR